VLPEGCVKLYSAFSLNKVHRVFSSFLGEKKDLDGFSGLMTVHKQPKISRRLAFCPLHNMDAATSSLVLRVGVKIKTTDSDVQLVLGVTKMVCIEQNLLIAVHMML
jgi:hypothetical protein